jgi:formylglycine-generating enzyme required for sulfatase activity
VSRSEITRAEFEAFMAAADYHIGIDCRTYEDGVWRNRAVRTFRSPGFAQQDGEPAACVTWYDARAYVAWLNGQIGVSGYRLIEADEWRELLAMGHASARRDRALHTHADGERDALGLVGMADNLSEWTGACARIATHPVRACVLRVRLGASWADNAGVGEAKPEGVSPLSRDSATGFRVVRAITETSAP